MSYIKLAGFAAVVIAFLSLGIWGVYQRSNAISARAERDKAYADLRLAVDANRTNQETIARLKADAERDNQLSAEVLAALDRISADVAEGNKTLDEMKDANEDVRAYLSGRVPADLDKLLNR